MNTPGHEHHIDEREACEWAAQERGRQQASDAAAALAGGSGFGREFFSVAEPSLNPDTTEAASYRRIAEALRRPPPVDLPPDFAARVARAAALRAPVAFPAAPESSRPGPPTQPAAFERALIGVLACAFALCTVVAALVYGARLSAQLQAALGVQGAQWTALLAGCLGLSWSFDWLRRRAGHGDNGQRLA